MTSLHALQAAGGNLGLLQLFGGGTGAAQSPHTIAQHGVAGASGALPHRDAIQASFGRHDVSGVKANVGGDAAGACEQLGASAYATGDRVGFASQPSLHTAAHEAAHVVQQRAGVSLYGGVGRAGDRYEQHADAVADRVVQGRSAEDLLETATGGSSGGAVQYEGGDGATNDVGPNDDSGGGGGAGSGDAEGEVCNAGEQFAPLIATLRLAKDSLPAVIDNLATLGPQQLRAVTDVFTTASADVSRWTQDEAGLVTQAFAEYLAGQRPGAMAYAGDALGVAAAINVANPEPVSKVVIGLVLIGIGFAVRAHNRSAAEEAAQARADMMQRNVGAPIGQLNEIQERNAASLINALLDSSLQVNEIAWTGGFLDALSTLVDHTLQDLDLLCTEESPNPDRIALEEQQATDVVAIYNNIAPEATDDVNTLNALPDEASAMAESMFATAVESYIQWLASAGAVQVAGSVTCDFQSGGNSTTVSASRCTGIGDQPAGMLGSTTKTWATYYMGDLIDQGVAYEFTADVTVHTYEQSAGTGQYDLPMSDGSSDGTGEAITVSDTCVFRITSDGVVELGATNAGSRVPYDEILDHFMGFRK